MMRAWNERRPLANVDAIPRRRLSPPRSSPSAPRSPRRRRSAVRAGVWLAGARPGDVLEIVSDDRAFDAVGDVAAALGITFHRLTARTLTGAPTAEPGRPASGGDRSRRRGRRGRRGGR